MDEFLRAVSEILKWISLDTILEQINNRKKQRNSNSLLVHLVELYKMLNRVVTRGLHIQQTAKALYENPDNPRMMGDLIYDLSSQVVELEMIVNLVQYNSYSFFVDKCQFSDSYFYAGLSSKNLLLLFILEKVGLELIKEKYMTAETLDITEVRKKIANNGGSVFAMSTRLLNVPPLNLRRLTSEDTACFLSTLCSQEAAQFLKKIEESRDGLKTFIERNFSIDDVLSSMAIPNDDLSLERLRRQQQSLVITIKELESRLQEVQSALPRSVG